MWGVAIAAVVGVSSAVYQSESNRKASNNASGNAVAATKDAADAAATATLDATRLNIDAQNKATAVSIQAANDASEKSNRLVAAANLLILKYTQEGVDFNNTEAAASVARIKTIFHENYDKNVAGFKDTYDAIKKQYDEGYLDIEKTLSPWIGTGTKANAQLENLAGLNGAEAGRNALITDPGYQFRVEQGQQALERSAAGKGNLFSGNTGVALQKYGQDMATDEFTNIFNRLMQLSEQGRLGSNALAGYRWNKTTGNVLNETALNTNMTGARNTLAGQDAAGEDYLSQTRIQGNNTMTGAKTAAETNALNVGMTGLNNITSATSGGAQANADIAIAGNNNNSRVLQNNAINVGNANVNSAYNYGAGQIYTTNNNMGALNNAVNTGVSIYSKNNAMNQPQKTTKQSEKQSFYVTTGDEAFA